MDVHNLVYLLFRCWDYGATYGRNNLVYVLFRCWDYG